MAYTTIEVLFTWKVGMAAVEWMEWLTTSILGVWGRGRIYYILDMWVGNGVGSIIGDNGNSVTKEEK